MWGPRALWALWVLWALWALLWEQVRRPEVMWERVRRLEVLWGQVRPPDRVRATPAGPAPRWRGRARPGDHAATCEAALRVPTCVPWPDGGWGPMGLDADHTNWTKDGST